MNCEYMIVDTKRLKTDLQYIILNRVINRVPSWTIRRLFYKLFGMRIGCDSRIGIGTVVYYPRGIKIGNRVVINEFCYLDGRGGISIDHDVSISIYTKIITGTHIMNDRDFKYTSGKVRIRHHVWIGTGAIILNDSLIAQNTVVGAGCVYKGITRSGDVIVGNPGKIIKKRDEGMSYKINYRPYFR